MVAVDAAANLNPPDLGVRAALSNYQRPSQILHIRKRQKRTEVKLLTPRPSIRA
jgi:hypothetical protein